jgi:aminopeptidase N
MRDAQPGTVFLKDYQPPEFLINRTELHFDLREDHVLVTSRLHMLRSSEAPPDCQLELHGQDVELVSVAVDGSPLLPSEYTLSDDKLVLARVPEQFVFSCVTRLLPQENTSLEGLYKSRSMYCTQCEAEGFRKITFYLDRPDVMSVFTVTVEADREASPVLLSNGNLVERNKLPGNRHSVTWHDPFPKPAYLFALVAGALENVQDSFQTCSGRNVSLRIYVEAKDLDKCAHAMISLKESMRWDEEVYGREYDLDVFNIVAVDDFNMGAMENKSLNIFNTSCVLCTPDITTDQGFQRVEAIVAHEYFHNWSGNRVTCRDWFQLSLKEGFTVFRDAEFSADMGSRTVKRVEDVTLLRTAQFAEDAGPMAHPVRPDSYMEINNFYTMTVYEKGAEVVRMIHTLLGAEAFRQGSDLYFERHDGQAVTCDDFVRAMEDASGVDLTQFRRWYSQSGTPEVRVKGEYNEAAETYTLSVSQSCPPTPGQSSKEPFVIPLAVGLLGEAGNLPLRLSKTPADPETEDNTHLVLTVDQPDQQFVFEGVTEHPVPSLLRGFSAPVRLDYEYSSRELCALMTRDDDGFVRWDSAQALSLRVINELAGQGGEGEDARVDDLLLQAFRDLLTDESLDPAMVAEMLSLPGENYLAEEAARNGGADVDAIHRARNAVRLAVGRHCRDVLVASYERLATDQAYRPDAGQIAARSLRNRSLDYLCAAEAEFLSLAEAQFNAAMNMTDRLAALRCLAFYGDPAVRSRALDQFYADWKHEALVVNQWLQVQAAIPDADALSRVQGLLDHADFDLRNPNKVRALVGIFVNQNPVNFHRLDGGGYRFLGEIVAQLNDINPQIAARLLTPLTKWRTYRAREDLMKAELRRLAELPSLSPDVYEVVSKSLK